jgi:hypothetical protein
MPDHDHMQELLKGALQEPPEVLVEMRRIARGGEPSAGFEWLADLKKTKPIEFLKEKRAEERQYAATQTQLLATANKKPGGEEPERGREPMIGVVEEWLKQHGVQY